MNLIVGLGKTGCSIARYFQRKGIAFDIFEGNRACPDLAAFKEVTIFHHITPEQLEGYSAIYLSPGVNPHHAPFNLVQEKLTNDLNLFTQQVKKPYIAVTGSNGKTTLVHLLEAALCGAGYKALAIGNNGVPMLDHVDDDLDYFILELSSYQLELAKPFLCDVAYVSNISQDHLDRHGTIERYAAIKETLYHYCRYAVMNEDDAFCQKMTTTAKKVVHISLSEAKINQVPALKMIGQHNKHNALAVMAICELLAVDMFRAKEAIAEFPGLEHRCEFILEKNAISWWNDSKGTNVDSTVTAIHSVSSIIVGKLVMILGGQGKGQDFSPLVDLLRNKARGIILLGENKYELETLFEGAVVVDTLMQAIDRAKLMAQAGDAVLLSPACASLDMFKDYGDRGRQFKNGVIEKV